MQYLTVDGWSIAYKAKWADNPWGSVIFVHGSGGDHHVWEAQLQLLPDSFTGIALDLPGHGHSSGPMLETIEAGAQLLSRLPAWLNLPRPLWLAGHSMGSAMAITAALDYGQPVDGLVLIGSGSRLRVLPALLDSLRGGNIDPSFLRVGFSPATPADIWEKELALMLQIHPEILLNDFSACDQFDRSADISAIKVPVLLITGEDDRLTPLKYAEFLRDRISTAKLIIVPQAGHQVMLEKPDAVSQAIADFLSTASN